MKHLTRMGQVAFTVIFVLSISLQGIQPASAKDDGVRISHNPHTGKVSFIGAAPGKPINIHAAQAPGMDVRDRALAMVKPYEADFGYVNKTGLTQLRLRFATPSNNNGIAD